MILGAVAIAICGCANLPNGNSLTINGGLHVIQIEMAMEARRLGLYRKPMLVVDNATVMQFSQLFERRTHIPKYW